MFSNASTLDRLPVSVREAAAHSSLPYALGVASFPLARRGTWCAATGAHAVLDRLPNEWMLRRATRIGRRAASARTLAVNVGQFGLRMENGEAMETVKSLADPERSAVCGIPCHQGRLTPRRDGGQDYGFLYSPRAAEA
ncbi:MAG: hypothetical protein OXG65_02380 [Chloroflexi bacterium]|nr:hypothetical protein [Chloroflexota bacterium]